MEKRTIWPFIYIIAILLTEIFSAGFLYASDLEEKVKVENKYKLESVMVEDVDEEGVLILDGKKYIIARFTQIIGEDSKKIGLSGIRKGCFVAVEYSTGITSEGYPFKPTDRILHKVRLLSRKCLKIQKKQNKKMRRGLDQ